MCGIVGFIDRDLGFDAGELAELVGRMADAMIPRGPDDHGVWTEAEAGVALGFRRLAIVDLSVEGRQPMISADGRYVIVFNGEIYNHKQVRAELEASDTPPRFRGGSDTEVMLAAFSRWGAVDAVRRFDGMFAFGLWDRRDRTLVLGRDRIGEKPLYYGWMGSTFLFGSVLETLRRHPSFRGEIDRDALVPYLQRGYVHGPASIHVGIRKLPPGTLLELRSTTPAGRLPDPMPYWSARDAVEAGLADPFRGGEDEATDELERILGRAVERQMVADVPLGAFLSGGIDSSTIVALMQARSTRPVRTFTIGFHEPEFDEARHAAAVARHLGTDHTELYVTPEQTLGVLPKLPELYDEPFADSSQIPTYLVSELARRSVTVSLSGDGGDEVFGGYERHIRPSLWYGLPGLPGMARRGGAAALRAIPERGWDAVFRAIAPVIPTRARRHAGGDRIHRAAEIVAGAGSPAEVYDQLSRQWDRAERIVIGTSGAIASPAAWPAVDHVAHGLMFADLVSYLPDDILVKVDRATMGVSLESRAPLLDHHVVEFAWRLPRSMKIGDGRGKLPLRRLLERFVPRSLFERPKMGFAVPVDLWLRGPLREWAETLLSESRLRDEGIFDPAPIRRRWTEHLAGRRNWKDSLWTVLMFQAWHESRPGARETQSSSGGSATLASAADQRP